MRVKHLKTISLTAIFTALVAAATMVITIPISGSGGYVNFGDTIIFVAAALLGPLGGFFSGAVGSSIADLVFAPKWIPVTFIVKGLEGLLCGLIILVLRKLRLKDVFGCIIAMTIAALIMVTGYFFGGWILEGLSSGSFRTGFAVAVADIPFNLIQGGVSAVAGIAITLALSRIKYVKNFFADNSSVEKETAPDTQKSTAQGQNEDNDGCGVDKR